MSKATESPIPHQIGLCPRRLNIPSFGAGPPEYQPNAQAPKGKKQKF
jgi:hypothetical protein